MSEFTAHVQLPDSQVGLALFDLTFGHPDVTTANLQGGAGTWLSFGITAEYEHEASMKIGKIRMEVSRMDESVGPFQSAPMIVTNGRTVVYSEGI